MNRVHSILLFVSVVLGSLSLPLVLAQDTLAGDNATGLTNGSSTGSNNDNTTGVVDDGAGSTDDNITDYNITTEDLLGCLSAREVAVYAQPALCGDRPLCDNGCLDAGPQDFVACQSSREYCAQGVCGGVLTLGGFKKQGENISVGFISQFVFTSGSTGYVEALIKFDGECSVDINNETCTSCAIVSCPNGDPNSTGLQIDCSNLEAGTLNTCQDDSYLDLPAGSNLVGLVLPYLDDCESSADDNTNSTVGTDLNPVVGTNNYTNPRSSAPTFVHVGRPFGFGLLNLGLAVFALSVVL